MKLLFITSGAEDYLADSLLHGFRSLFGERCIDYPKAEHMYAGYQPPSGTRLYGGGFTLYGGLLEDLAVDRSLVETKVRKGFFDRVIFGNIWKSYGLFAQWRPFLEPAKTVICDGADSPQVYPYAGLWWRRPSQWLAPRAHPRFLYFKREWTEGSQFNFWHRTLPKPFRKRLRSHRCLHRISFSIPEEKIVATVPKKSKDFATHCVDPEVAEKIPGCKTSYAFDSESDYYADLQASRFAITTKRAGWDCLRHYEIAANGCVPCFRDLQAKAETCGPHGLNESNSMTYTSPDDLLEGTGSLSEKEFAGRQAGALDWVRSHSTKNEAQRLLLAWNEAVPKSLSE